MTEAEIFMMRGDLTDTIISLVSVSFGMISAYIVGLWLVLKDVPVLLRMIGFSLLSCGLLFMGVIGWGIHEMMLGVDRAWTKIGSPSSEIPNFGGERPEYLYGLSLYEAGTGLGFIAFGLIYLALFYLTFLYRWSTPSRQER